MRDLIALCAFPKSGVTYLGHLLFDALFGDEADPGEMERRYVIDAHAFPELAFARPEGPRLVKTHAAFAPDDPVVARATRAVYLIRHPIDVMMSAWDFRYLMGEADGPPRDPAADPAFRAHVRAWLESGGAGFDVAGTWVGHVRSWLGQTAIPVHRVTYEDLVDHPARELAALLTFLGLAVPADRQARAVERSSMAAMAAMEAREVREGRTGLFYRPALAGGYARGHRFVNKGHRDSWRTVLTDAERALADRTFGAELKAYFPAP